MESIKEDRPIITSECPGWICYVEKVVKDPIISLCSRVKTPQMLAGQLLKSLLVESGVALNQICLASVNPCHDKKLESFRLEGMLSEEVRALDIVLTTTELIELINLDKAAFDFVPSVPLMNWHPEDLFVARVKKNAPLTKDDFTAFKHSNFTEIPLFTSSSLTSTSNNYINQIFVKAILDNTGQSVDESSISETLRRNKKGFGVISPNLGSGVQRSSIRANNKGSTSVWVQEHSKPDKTHKNQYKKPLQIHRADGMSWRLL